MNIIYFIGFTYLISLSGFLIIYPFEALQNPESIQALPFWLLMIWGPSLSAIILSYKEGRLKSLFKRAIKYRGISPFAWLLTVFPIVLFIALQNSAPDPSTIEFSVGLVFILIAFNLILGPIGEELGWRGFLQEKLIQEAHWLKVSMIIGVIWFIWHMPLWTFESPHSKISIHLFAAHCFLYSIIIGAIYQLSGGSILTSILAHLTFNLASGMAALSGYVEPNSWFLTSFFPYVCIAIIAVYLVERRNGLLKLLNKV